MLNETLWVPTDDEVLEFVTSTAAKHAHEMDRVMLASRLIRGEKVRIALLTDGAFEIDGGTVYVAQTDKVLLEMVGDKTSWRIN